MKRCVQSIVQAIILKLDQALHVNRLLNIVNKSLEILYPIE